MDNMIFRQVRYQWNVDRLFIRFIVNFGEALQTDFRILRGVKKMDDLIDRSIELSKDEWYCHHRTDGKTSWHNLLCGEKKDDDVLGLIKKQGPHLLVLV